MKAVDGATFSVRPRRDARHRRRVGLGQVDDVPVDPATGARAGRAASWAASIAFDGEDLLAKSPEEMRQLRGSRIAMILQDPMASLNPAMTVGAQIAETLTLHRGLRGRRARRARAGALAPGAHQRPRAPRARLSAPDERRHPPARGRRHRHLLPAEPADRRRADDLARRDDPGPVPAPAEGHPARDESRPGLRHPRPRHRGQAVRPRGRHVRRADRGDGDDARDLQPAAPPVHDRAAELPAHAAPRPRAADRDRRPAARTSPHVPGRLRFAPRCPLAEPRCSRTRPPLEPVASEHLVACLRADETPR